MSKFTALRPLLLGSFLLVTFFASSLYALAYVIAEVELISISTTGGTGNSDSVTSEISDDNRYVLFDSSASNLVSGDTNGTWDIFLRDRSSNTTTLISKASDGEVANDFSFNPRMSDDARYIAYESDATDIVAGDTNASSDVFLYDTVLGTTSLISRMSGAEGMIVGGDSTNVSVSDDGSLVAFDSEALLEPADLFGQRDIFIRDITTQTVTPLSVTAAGAFGNADSYSPQIAGDEGYVVFTSYATNLESGDTNGVADVFIKKPTAGGSLWRISKTSSGGQTNGASGGPMISDDGNYISYTSEATNIVADDTNGMNDVFLYDFSEDETILISRANGTGVVGNGSSYFAQVNEDGTRVVFISSASNLVEGDTNGTADVFVYDIEMQTVQRVSTDEEGNQISDHDITYVNISPDGTEVIYNSPTEAFITSSTPGEYNVFVAEIEAEAYNLLATDLSYDETSGEFSYTVENNGNTNIPTTDIFSTITVTNPDDTEETVSNADTDDDDSILEKDESATYTVSLVLDAGASTIEVCTDSGEDVEESSEADNCDELIVTIGAGDDDNDIVVDDDDADDDEVVVDGDDDDNGGGLADDADDELTCDNPFTDTVGHWGEKTICLIALQGTVSGKVAGVFDPDDQVTRAEILKMILLNAGEEIPSLFDENPFSDVNTGDWYFEYVLHGSDLGVVEGYDTGDFRPNEPVNRAEALTMILRMANVADESSMSSLDFDDLDEEDWFFDEVGLGVDYLLVEGYEDGTFMPGGNITRAEAATMIRRAWYVWYQ